MKSTVKDKVDNESKPDSIATVERLAEQANMSIDMRGGAITRRDGFFEIWCEERGGHSYCIAREATKRKCINATCKYLRKLADELAALAVEDAADEA